MQFAFKPKTAAQLVSSVTPKPGQLEAVPDWIVDIQTYTSGTTVQQTFFSQTNSNKSMCNLQQAGVIAAPQYFELFAITIDFFRATATGALGDVTAATQSVGPIADVGALVQNGLGRWTLYVNEKPQGPYPLSVLHGSGGPTGFGWGTVTAEETVQYANNAIFDGGAFYGGSVVIQGSFGFVIDYPAALTLSGDYYTKVILHGMRYRKIV